MIFYETLFTVQIQRDIKHENAQEEIGKAINKAMLSDPTLKELHAKNTFKMFCYSSLYPRKENKVYQAGEVFLFNLRSPNLQFIMKIKNLLPTVNGSLKVLACEIRNYQHRHITSLITLTPSVSTINNRCWTKESGLETIIQKMHNNAVRKAKLFWETFEEPSHNFIQGIIQLNNKCIKIPYKQTSLIGNKFHIQIHDDPISQQLGWIVLSSGLLEKNSIGCGYCIINDRAKEVSIC